MKQTIISLFVLSMFALASCKNTTCDKQPGENMQSQTIFERGNKLSNANFTGNAWLNSLIDSDSLNQNSVGSVTFESGARTYWHSHPAGQIILALKGVGYYKEEGKPVVILHKGDVVKCPHNIPHWHGASPDSEFVQVAITGRENGSTVWHEAVTDEAYNNLQK